jgi:hypothetical protein
VQRSVPTLAGYGGVRDYRVSVRTSRNRPLVALVLVLCALAAAVPAGQAKPAPGVRAASGSLLGGVSIGSSQLGATPGAAAHAIAIAIALHAKVVRVEVPWNELEPNAHGQVEPHALAATDRLVTDAAAAGIRVIMLVQGTPCWASTAPEPLLQRCRSGSSPAAYAWPPAQPSSFGAFTAFLAARYGSRLAAIEIWNEPDQRNEDYLAGSDKAQHYAELLRAAYPAIKRVDPSLPVLAGAIVGTNGAFLRAMYAAGIKGYYNGLAVHYYTLTIASLRYIHEVQLANGDHTPLWLDEFGWSSCWPKHSIEEEQACVTPQIQAQNVTNTFRALARMPYVAAAVLYKLQDTRGEEFGVLSATGAHKPAFAALARVLDGPGGGVSRATVQLRVRGNHLLASGSGPVGDVMDLEAFQGTTLRFRATFTLERFNRYAISLPALLGTKGLRVRVYQQGEYGAGAAHAAQAAV